MKRLFHGDRSKLIEHGVIGAAGAGLACVTWWRMNGAATWVLYAYIAGSVIIGLALYFTLSDYDQLLRRRLVLVLLGSGLFGAAALRDPLHGLFQIEGFFFDLLSGVFMAAVIHYLLAKIVGPLIFGRVWCGWACWTAMVLDQLPFKRSHGRLGSHWGSARYVHFVLSFMLVAGLWYGWAYKPGAGAMPALFWFLLGNTLYLLLGVTLAFALKDNRAFCKYLCPVAVPLKLSGRFALLKVKGKRQTECCNDRVCEKVCPMDIRIVQYVQHGKRVLASECILCQACISVCPEQALELSFGFDLGSNDQLHERGALANKSSITGSQGA